MSDEKNIDTTPVQPIPDKVIDSPQTRTDDQPDSLKPAHTANVGTWRELTSDALEPVRIAERKGMFGARSQDTTGYGGVVQPVLFPGASPRPYGSYFDEVADRLGQALGTAEGPSFDTAVERVVVDRGELTLFVRREHLPAVARAMRDVPELRFEMCLGVSGVHFPEQDGRELHAVYHLMSITHGSRRVRLEVTAPDADPHIPSIVSTYPGIDWHERETWDMFGIVFDGHPALTRILMPDDWPGHPQRKDYPLGGIPVEYKGGTVPPPDERRAYS
ncbi:MAG TPA: NADH-quinone oxidoreductase subunit C [Ornithinibacter sp.]|jgi:NADH-quinone oxidoreductase subunit C|nr:NADH-quinone oxidoreductase subunit C [Ornithinibacter sp.]